MTVSFAVTRTGSLRETGRGGLARTAMRGQPADQTEQWRGLNLARRFADTSTECRHALGAGAGRSGGPFVGSYAACRTCV